MSQNASAGGPLACAVTAYLDWHALRGSSVQHRKDVRYRLGSLAGTLDPDLPLAEISRDHCTALLRSVEQRGCKPNTQFAYFRVLEAFFNWLVEDERLSRSPMERVPKPKVPQEQIKPLSQEEVRILLGTPDQSTFVGLRDTAFMALLVDTGLRLSEASNIHLNEINMRERSISVLGKGSKPRTVFYGESAAQILRTYLRRRGTTSDNDCLFVNSLAEPLWKCTMTHRIHAYGLKAGIKGKRVSPHTLRHTFAVSWLMGGGDAFSLQRLLGHSTAVMTARYVNFTSEDLGKLHRTVSPLDRLQGELVRHQPRDPLGRKRIR